MKITTTSIGFIAIVTAFLPALNMEAGSPTYPSSAATDVQLKDSLKLYPEESQRASLIKGTRVVYVNGAAGQVAPRDSAESLISRFYDDQFRHSQDPEAPIFTFMSKDADLAMGIGAKVALSGWFYWNGFIAGSGFSPYDIEIPKNYDNLRSLNGTASGSSIFFTVLGKNKILGNYKVYVQGGFNGYKNSGFKLKKAYVQLYNFTAGLAPTTFSDPSSEPDVLDPAGSNGIVSKSNLLVRYMRSFKGKWSVGASVEFPSSQPDIESGFVTKITDYVPDFAALGQFQWNRGLSHIRLAGIVRTMSYRDLNTGKSHAVTGWGALLGSTIKAGSILTFYAQGSLGQGMSAYTGDLSNGNYDLLADPADPYHLYAPLTISATVGLKCYWMSNLSSTVAVGTQRSMAKKGTYSDSYKYGQYLAANIVYNITPRLQVGLEYEAGKRMNFNGSHGNANRLAAAFTASF